MTSRPVLRRGGDGDATPDVVVVGAGIVGACCALALSDAGAAVTVLDRGGPAGGTTSAGEGNLLVSDKVPGPELDLARRSVALWGELAARLGDGVEYERKGGVVTARTAAERRALHELAAAQVDAGVAVELLEPDALLALEPLLSPALAGGAHYPEDAQVQPMLATERVLGTAGAVDLRCYTEVLGVRRAANGDHVLHTTTGRLTAPHVVLAAGPWSGELAARFGAELPVRPRRGHIVVTEPVTPQVRHKVYAADYVDTVLADERAVRCSPVVEHTASGTMLLGSSRELVGFDRRPSPAVIAEISARAVELFPFLARVRAIRAYLGFRPATPDHLPVIGADPRVPGLHHATGHEGAGIGLAPATAELVAAAVVGSTPPLDPAPFAPDRFTSDDAGPEASVATSGSPAGSGPA